MNSSPICDSPLRDRRGASSLQTSRQNHRSYVLDCKTVRIFAYSSTREQSNKKSGTRLKTESETWGETLKIRPTGVRGSKTLTARFTDFFTDFEEKTDCFAVYDVCTEALSGMVFVPAQKLSSMV